VTEAVLARVFQELFGTVVMLEGMCEAQHG